MSRSMASAMVATRATAMPAMPKVLPALAVSCLDSPARARMNSRAATMYAACAAVSMVIGDSRLASDRSASGEHGEHPAGHREAAEDVDAGQQDRHEGQHGDQPLRRPWPICSSAPTTMIPEIALVTDISGVCRAWCTCPIT